MSEQQKQLFQSRLATLLTAIGAVLLSFNIGTENEIGLWSGLVLVSASAVFSWVRGYLFNWGSWVKKLSQSIAPITVYYGLLDAVQATAILTTVATIIPLTWPSEK